MNHVRKNKRDVEEDEKGVQSEESVSRRGINALDKIDDGTFFVKGFFVVSYRTGCGDGMLGLLVGERRIGRPGTYMARRAMVAGIPSSSFTSQFTVPIAVAVSWLAMPLMGIPGRVLTLLTKSLTLLV